MINLSFFLFWRYSLLLTSIAYFLFFISLHSFTSLYYFMIIIIKFYFLNSLKTIFYHINYNCYNYFYLIKYLANNYDLILIYLINLTIMFYIKLIKALLYKFLSIYYDIYWIIFICSILLLILLSGSMDKYIDIIGNHRKDKYAVY